MVEVLAVKFDLLHPRDQLVTIMNRVYHNGMTTLSGGNLSIKEPNGDLWITPAAIDKGKLRPADIMLVRADGTVEGPHLPSSELPFHRAIYARRPDLQAIVHAHAPALVSYSIARQIPDTSIIPQAQRVCGPVGYAPYAMPGSEQLGANIAATFAEDFNVVLLENHGTATGGVTLLEAFQRLETLDFCARTLMRAQGLGEVTRLSEAEIAQFDQRASYLPEFDPESHSSLERDLRQQIAEIVRRACDRYLMISTEGVVSARVEEHAFLITPTGVDRRGLDHEDIVLIRDGQREAGKLPSRSVRLHRAIYEANPQVNSIIMAQSPNATAYAISSRPLDTKTIPESYIMLQEIPRLPYGVQFADPRQVAAIISGGSPVVLLQNDCILTTGQSVLQAFDRLEVAEFTAKSLIETATIGKLVPIGNSEIRDLQRWFLAHVN
jgi:L-fuculose-phosphate aldolase